MYALLYIKEAISCLNFFPGKRFGRGAGLRGLARKGIRARGKFQSPPIQRKEEIRADISDLLLKKVKSKKTRYGMKSTEGDEAISLHIWDFAGHELYYTTHQVISS